MRAAVIALGNIDISVEIHDVMFPTTYNSVTSSRTMSLHVGEHR